MLRKLRENWRSRRAASRDRDKARYLESRRPHAYAPFDSALYARLLRQARASSHELAPFLTRTQPDASRARLYFRHDVDTPACVANLPMLLEINLAEKVPAPVYVRTDGVDYAPEELAPTVECYRARGVDFGLHSSCYTEDDYWVSLRRETERFERCFGFRPRSFTVHGLGQYRMGVRTRFADEAVERLGELGFAFTDCHRRMRGYDYVIQDCHLDPVRKSRFAYDDIVTLPAFFQPGRNYLVLTHPCYWR